MLRMAGGRWKEATLSGEVQNAEEAYIEAGLTQIGRSNMMGSLGSRSEMSSPRRTMQAAR